METSRPMERFFPSRVIKSFPCKNDHLHFDEFFIQVTELQLNNDFLSQELSKTVFRKGLEQLKLREEQKKINK